MSHCCKGGENFLVLLKAAHNAPRRLEYPSLIISMYRLGSREGVFADEPHHGLVSEDLVVEKSCRSCWVGGKFSDHMVGCALYTSSLRVSEPHHIYV